MLRNSLFVAACAKRSADCPKGSYCEGGQYVAANDPNMVRCTSYTLGLDTIGQRSVSKKACGACARHVWLLRAALWPHRIQPIVAATAHATQHLPPHKKPLPTGCAAAQRPTATVLLLPAPCSQLARLQIHP